MQLVLVKIAPAIGAICHYEKGALMCKVDISDAFKKLRIKPSQWLIFV